MTASAVPSSPPPARPSAATCSVSTAESADALIRVFFAFAESGDERSLAACLAPGAESGISAAAWARTRGADRLQITLDRAWANSHEVVRVEASLRDGSPVSWPAGETRWFQIGATPKEWRLEGITVSPRPTEDEIWGMVLRQLPPNVLILRPGWLPDDFSLRLPYLWGVHAFDEPTYWLDYSSPTRLISFHRGGGNSAPPTSIERITFRGGDANISMTNSWPGIQLTWREDGYSYQIQMATGTRDELMRIANALLAARSTARQ